MTVDPLASVLPASLPPMVSESPIERRGWQNTVAPHFIGLFLWIAYFDQLGTRALPMGGIGWSVLGAAAGAAFCALFLYQVPATWGWKTGRPLGVVATSTFGIDGSVPLTGIVVGLALIVWQAIATYYAVELTFEGLAAAGLLDPRYLKSSSLGSLPLKGPLFLLTSLTWSFAAALVGMYLVRVIAALMKVYPVFPALMLAAAMLLTLKGLRGFRPSGVDPATGELVRNGGPRAFALIVQMIVGFFSLAGVTSCDWGAVCRDRRDVRLGGFVGVGFAAWIIATLSMLTLAGIVGSNAQPAPRGSVALGEVPAFHAAVFQHLGGRVAAALLILFGLASLAPNCYASFSFGQRFAAAWPRYSRLTWTLVGTSASWLLVATGAAGKLPTIFDVMGAVFAPMAGALAADYTRSRGEWPGPRRGVNQAGLVAWALGLTVGLLPTLGRVWGLGLLASIKPAAVYAFVAAYLAYQVLAKAGMEPSAIEVAEAPPAPLDA